MMNFNQQELQIGGYINHTSDTYGMDSLSKCYNKTLFKAFPHKVSYQFNELGYRERPVAEYNKNAVIAVGDSFTVGLGLPVELTYPAQLERLCKHQVLNFSLNGASNEWIARKLEIILKYVDPAAIIVHYTFSHRRENNELTWFDDERTLSEPNFTADENYANWETAHKRIQWLVNKIPMIYSHIPQWHLDKKSVNQIDYARDQFHYGPTTCSNLARQYADCINRL